MDKHKCEKIYLVGLLFSIIILIMACCMRLYSPLVIDVHEHIESLAEAELLLKANDINKISKTILIPTPTETLTLNGHKSFSGYRENMKEILMAYEKYPNRFIPFCTVNPLESDALSYLKSCIDRGGQGIKLYNGHSYYHEIFNIPLDSPRMLPIYAFAERSQLPILFHVNITKYGQELENVLDAYPNLFMLVPHFMVSSIDLEKVASMLDKYPNLYTDISFGSPEFMAAGFKRISKDSEKYGNFMSDYYDRVLFGADLVLTGSEKKDISFIIESQNCYKDLLSKRRFVCNPVAEYYSNALKRQEESYERCKPKDGDYCLSMKQKVDEYQKRYQEVLELNGLNLSHVKLEEIYRNNPEKFLNANR